MDVKVGDVVLLKTEEELVAEFGMLDNCKQLKTTPYIPAYMFPYLGKEHKVVSRTYKCDSGILTCVGIADDNTFIVPPEAIASIVHRKKIVRYHDDTPKTKWDSVYMGNK